MSSTIATSTPHAAHWHAQGKLYRAIVTLPPSMCSRDHVIQERWVFFEAPRTQGPVSHLVMLLALMWNTDATELMNSDGIYNVVEASELIDQNDGNDDTALFECAWGGKDGVQYVKPDEVDYFVTPRVRAALETAHARALGWSRMPPTPAAEDPAKQAADKAIKHVLRRIQDQPKIAWYFGPASHSMDLLTDAHAMLHGLNVCEFRKTFYARLTFEQPKCSRCKEATCSTH